MAGVDIVPATWRGRRWAAAVAEELPAPTGRSRTPAQRHMPRSEIRRGPFDRNSLQSPIFQPADLDVRRAARCREMRPSLNSTCARRTPCKQARVACRRAWMVERPPQRQSSPSCSGFVQLPEVALVVSSVVSYSWKFDERSATDTIASGSPASTRPDRREGELP